MIPLFKTIRVVAADKKIAGLVAAGFMAVIWCILMHFSQPFPALHAVHIHAVSQKACVFNGLCDLQIRHNLHFAE
jgi:hypothetical protein